MAAAAEDGIKTIGVDVNQKADSETVITSATKGLGASVEAVLDAIYNGGFDQYAGKTTYFTAANNGVGLPDDFERFIGDKSMELSQRLENYIEALKRLKDRN